MSIKRLSYIFLLLILASCSEDFKVNADWKNITVVYGLLNPNQEDSIHYIRITHGFTNENASAREIALNEFDSLYYEDSLFVKLEKWRNGNHILPDINLYRIYNEEKDTNGDFYAPGQYLYRTPSGTVLDKNASYKLIVRNPATNDEVSSETNMIGDIIQYIPPRNGLLHFDTANTTKVIWKPGENAYFYNMDVKFRYYEYPKGKPQLRELKEISFKVASFYLTNDLLSDMEIEIEGKKFFEVIYDQIVKDPDYKDYTREFPSKNVELVYYAGGKEIYYYLNVNQPSIGVVEKKPEYSNITNGYGVFSCRNVSRFTTDLSQLAKIYLMTSDQMIDLNFIE